VATDVHNARVISEISVAWTLIASTAAIALALITSNAALAAFGAVGFVDMIGSIALVHHFRHAIAHAGMSDRFEQRAHRIVVVGLFSVGIAAVVVSGVRLAAGAEAEKNAASVAIAAVSLVVLSVLAISKMKIGRRVPSAALVSDGHLSAIGATQAAAVLLGTVFAADNAAAFAVGAVAIVLSVTTWRQIPAGP
jgi:hypothetical protein